MLIDFLFNFVFVVSFYPGGLTPGDTAATFRSFSHKFASKAPRRSCSGGVVLLHDHLDHVFRALTQAGSQGRSFFQPFLSTFF